MYANAMKCTEVQWYENGHGGGSECCRISMANDWWRRGGAGGSFGGPALDELHARSVEPTVQLWFPSDLQVFDKTRVYGVGPLPGESSGTAPFTMLTHWSARLYALATSCLLSTGFLSVVRAEGGGRRLNHLSPALGVGAQRPSFGKDLADRPFHVGERKWFSQANATLFHNSVAGFAISGHEHKRDVGASAAQSFGEFESVRAGKVEVRENQINQVIASILRWLQTNFGLLRSHSRIAAEFWQSGQAIALHLQRLK